MTDRHENELSRRTMLKALAAAPLLLAAPALLGLPACDAAGSSLVLSPTPACEDDDDGPTPAQTEGPYFTPNSPLRTSLLETGMAGTVLVLTGQVLTAGCSAVPNALLDFWQADDGGEYDSTGYRLRGHQFTDAQGGYRLETIVPGLYPGRTRHIHVKVQAPGGGILTTQLYFPGEARNASDGIFRSELLMDITESGSTRAGTFNFVLKV